MPACCWRRSFPNTDWPAGFPGGLPARAVVRLLRGAVIFLKSHDNVYVQCQAGFLSDEAWGALRVQLKEGLNDPRTWSRAAFEDNPGVWRESYRRLILELLEESPAGG